MTRDEAMQMLDRVLETYTPGAQTAANQAARIELVDALCSSAPTTPRLVGTDVPAPPGMGSTDGAAPTTPAYPDAPESEPRRGALLPPWSGLSIGGASIPGLPPASPGESPDVEKWIASGGPGDVRHGLAASVFLLACWIAERAGRADSKEGT